MKRLIVRLLPKIAVAICLAWLCTISFTGLGLVKSASAHESASCYGEACNGSYPQGIYGCTNLAYSIKQTHLGLALVSIMYSAKCNATFVRVISNQGFEYLGITYARTYPYIVYVDQATWTMLYSRMIGWNGQTIYTYVCAGEYNCGYLVR